MKHECPYCGANVSKIVTLVTYSATLTEENGQVIVDKPEEVIDDVQYENADRYICKECGQGFNKLKNRA